ncbi:uncharacterized protein LOC125052274 [Pieris napi]|uniref:uncharacterized protein LOC125052274 n=1 Tax=Pieris napi TaxID=78633 RepID=UPI001FB96E24|nr:uncharacterized protein LOC125052274 [Pieris napi]
MDFFLWKTLALTFSKKLVDLRKKFTMEKKCDVINDVLIYGSNDTEEWKKQVGLNNLFCILYMIVHAARTINISIPSLESDSITKSLIQVKIKNNVEIRLIVHRYAEYCNLQGLAENGIRVKVINSIVKLEHEFIIIDGDCSDSVAILGSLDFEVNRVNCSRDITILSSDFDLISSLQREFNRVWCSVDDTQINKFDDIDE